RLQHRDVDAGDLEFLVLLRVSGDLVLRERLAQADLVRAWITPLTGDGERVVDTPEVTRFAHVVADDGVREDDVPRPLERAAELHLIGESRDPSPTAGAEDAQWLRRCCSCAQPEKTPDSRSRVRSAVDSGGSMM